MIVNSYHPGYDWTDREIGSIMAAMGVTYDALGKIDDRDAPVSVRVRHMDSKRIQDEAVIAATSANIAEEIAAWPADIVLTCDDNAIRYLVIPHLITTGIPVLHCGVNQSSSEYKLPPEQVTGILETDLYEQMITSLRQYAAGSRLGHLAADSKTNRKHQRILQQLNGDRPVAHHFYTDAAGFRQGLIDLQEKADIIVISNPAPVCNGPEDPVFQDMLQASRELTRVPTGCTDRWFSELTLMSFSKKPEELGDWVGRQALRVLQGTSPADIPETRNSDYQLYLNMDMAKRLDVQFPIDMVERARLIAADTKRVLFVSSYHSGYGWSDGIEAGLIKALELPGTSAQTLHGDGITLRIVRMDSRRQQGEEHMRSSAAEALAVIETWQPDVVITADDNAAKFLVAEHLTTRDIPVVFCGVNWDATAYGFSVPHITGMVEVDPIDRVIAELSKHTDGRRIGYLAADAPATRKVILSYKEHLGITFADGAFVSTMADFKREYQRLQGTVDMLFIKSLAGIEDLDMEDLTAFCLAEARIPSGCTLADSASLVLYGSTRVPEEQGWWSGQTARRILAGTKPSDIPISRNQGNHTVINLPMARKLGIVFNPDQLADATLYGH
ncbi:MAG: ABC transporter substrate binding protein [Planctomycetota bacterium]|nr:ABC transporter substrate binding protein [Planctomycetota bacterium]